jgi:hypothetical protein
MSLSIDEKILIKNLCEWNIYFKRINGVGDISLPPKTTIKIDRGEVISQVQTNNVFFVGSDGKGSHARIFIEDKPTRIECGFETEEKEQDVITESKVKEIFTAKNFNTFKKGIENIAKSHAEKVTLVNLVKKLNLNEYDKIKFIEAHTGMEIK